MRKLIVSSILATAAFCLATPAHAQLKVGIVDMTSIFTSYYKTKDAEAQMNTQQVAAKKELDDRLDALKKVIEEINTLAADAEKPELSKDAKDKLAKQRDEKVGQERNMEKEATDFRQSKERDLQAQIMRMRKGIVEEIMVVVNDKVKTGGYDLVLDKSGFSLAQIPVILYSRSDMDFSNDVIATLNKNAPKAPSAAN